MMEEQENVYYYLTVMNEAYAQPAMPKGKDVEDGIMRGMYLLDSTGKPGELHVQLMGSGTILREVREAAAILKEDFGVSADIWSVTSFNELRRDGLAVERDNRLHPTRKPKASFVEQCLDKRQGPVVAATDYMKLYADQIRQWVPAPYKVLGTDGFGRSDSRRKLRQFFEVDRHWVAYTALSALVEQGKLKPKVLTDALKAFGIDPAKTNPLDC